MDLEIAQLVDRFDTGEIRLPLMQRDYVWRAKKVTERGFNTGRLQTMAGGILRQSIENSF